MAKIVGSKLIIDGFIFTYFAANVVFVPIGTVKRRGLENVQQGPSLLQLLLKKGL